MQPPWPCSALPGPIARQEKEEPPLGRCHASALPGEGTVHPQDPIEASQPQEQSLSQKNDTGVGSGGCPRCSRQAHHLLKCKSTSSPVGPICSPRISTAGACPPSAEHPQPEHATKALTRLRGWKLPPGPRQQAEHSLHPMSSLRRGSPRPRAAAGAPHQHASMSGVAAIYETSSKKALLSTAPVPKLYPPLLYISVALSNKTMNLNSPDPWLRSTGCTILILIQPFLRTLNSHPYTETTGKSERQAEHLLLPDMLREGSS